MPAWVDFTFMIKIDHHPNRQTSYAGAAFV
jgi:hypothetical protein